MRVGDTRGLPVPTLHSWSLYTIATAIRVKGKKAADEAARQLSAAMWVSTHTYAQVTAEDAVS